MAGTCPPPLLPSGEIVGQNPQSLPGVGGWREWKLAFDWPGAPTAHLILFIPTGRTKPPVILGMNFRGNHTLLEDPGIAFPTGFVRVDDPSGPSTLQPGSHYPRGMDVRTWDISRTLKEGWAIASLHYGDVEPDLPSETLGVRATHPDRSWTWGAIRAWAWGLQCAQTFLETISEIDASRCAVVGHSRLGKVALWAAAYDERFRVILSNQSGCGGAAPSHVRGVPGIETIDVLCRYFPHWFCKKFHTYAEDPLSLPFDQDALLTLCAPRPLLLANAQEDSWANPAGQLEMLHRADRTYRDLGFPGEPPAGLPPLGQMQGGRLTVSFRAGPHSMGEADWIFFRAFLQKWLPPH